jgi:ribokinase
MIKVIAIGRCCYDINLDVDQMPAEGSVMEFPEKQGCGGGSGANMAYCLAKWGAHVSFSGVLGNDVFGTRIKKEFESVHIDMRYLEQVYDADTTITLNITNKNTKVHTSFNIYDKYVSCKKLDYDFTPDLIICDGYDPVADKQVLERFPKVTSILDASIITKYVSDIIHKFKYCICSLEFAEALAGVKADFNRPETLVSMYQKIHKSHQNTHIIITLGAKGAMYFVNNQIKVSPSLKVDTIDTTGSGAAFRAGFAYSIMQDGDLEKAVKFGNIAGSLSTTKKGGRSSFPNITEVKNLYEQNYE